MRIGLLLAGHLTPGIAEAAGGSYEELYTRVLRRGDPSIQTAAYEVWNGVFPESPSECDGWLVGGSPRAVFDREDWIDDLKEFVRQVHAERRRLVGICFGHQLIADALGGKVERAEGWRLGPQRLDVSPQRWFAGGSLHLNASHQDAVTRLPDEAEFIGAGTTADVAAYRVGDHILCVQDHPEFDANAAVALLEHYTERLSPAFVSDTLESIATTPVDNDVLGVWLADFFEDRTTAAPKVESVQVGSLEPIEFGGRVEDTGIRKHPVPEARITLLGVESDAIADLVHHGGVDQAVYVYTRDDYRWWEAELGRPLPAGSFGENLTISDTAHRPVRAGDRITIGEVVLEITAPRIPCGTFQAVMGEQDWPRRFNAAKRPGYYCRVVHGGTVRAGDAVQWSPGSEDHVSIVEMLDIHQTRDVAVSRIERALASPIAERFRRGLEARLARQQA